MAHQPTRRGFEESDRWRDEGDGIDDGRGRYRAQVRGDVLPPEEPNRGYGRSYRGQDRDFVDEGERAFGSRNPYGQQHRSGVADADGSQDHWNREVHRGYGQYLPDGGRDHGEGERREDARRPDGQRPLETHERDDAGPSDREASGGTNDEMDRRYDEDVEPGDRDDDRGTRMDRDRRYR